MKLIRMTKTLAGPNGVRQPGMKPFPVSDEEAAALVAAEAAEIIAEINDAETAVNDDIETATAEPAAEQAVQPKPKRRKRSNE